MDHGNDINESPSIHRSQVIEKRMEMIAMLLDKLNGEEIVQQSKTRRVSQKRKGRNNDRFIQIVAGIFFHRIR
ncbi:hypothetical protein SAMN05216378_5826 [Paenibacillus catalpae]|uniref:Uncharacterized protein n=1 Tax=Paenibacillus catalpae TaxID=1045775 RepID=A0A1I2HKI1_9BACL|nr:hypothetical protein [Paenibacillus catalpae]SFF29266.1 hypothetical protein SAMN05216378_5826 [Paenibacillus catalpae]